MKVNFRLSLLILETLIQNGCKQFVFSPGARNSPFTRSLLALSSLRKIEVESHFDERGAAFFALGMAKSFHRPAVIITTSGTAVANLYPAVVEAFHSDVPLVVVTADRPKHLHEISSNQTIEQKDFFKNFTRAGLMISDYQKLTSEDEDALLNDVKQVILKLQYGPIHINCPFDEPLLERERVRGDVKNFEEVDIYIKENLNHDFKIKSISQLKVSSHKKESYAYKKYSLRLSEWVSDFLKNLEVAVRGLIIVGELNQTYKKRDIFSLIEFLMEKGWYVIAEINSGMRHFFYSNAKDDSWDDNDQDFVLENYSLLLKKNKFTQQLGVDTIVHIGGRLISQNLSSFLKKNYSFNYIHINRSSHYFNPDKVIKTHYQVDPPLFCRTIMDVLNNSTISREHLKSIPNHLYTSFKKKNYRFRKIDLELSSYVKRYVFQGFNELEISRTLAHFSRERLEEQEKNSVFIGNSMPIRDFNLMGYELGFTNVFSNRGVSGIDGLVATAAGIAKGRNYGLTKKERRSRFYTMIGDLSALHDINSLVFCRKNADDNCPITLLVINNREGTIFRHLPTAEVINFYPGYKKFYYQHEFDFAAFSEAVSLEYCKVKNASLFKKVLEDLHQDTRSYLIELEVDPEVNWEEHLRFHIDAMNQIDYLWDQYY